MTVARVFPRRTVATPNDPLAFVGAPGLFVPEVDAVHVSVTFSWDLPEANRLAMEWGRIAPVTIGGPAAGMRGFDFTPGMYLKPGYVITSRGCPNRCWFCSVWKRDGQVVRELPIAEGWNVLDDNLLACSRSHVEAVIAMLTRQTMRPPEFTGGIEASRLEPWSAEALRSCKPKQLFLAYDTPDDWEPLIRGAEMLWRAGFTKASHAVRCYVLCGYPQDSIGAADIRMRDVMSIGVVPMAMLWRNKDGKTTRPWRQFQRTWARPTMICAKGRAA